MDGLTNQQMRRVAEEWQLKNTAGEGRGGEAAGSRRKSSSRSTTRPSVSAPSGMGMRVHAAVVTAAWFELLTYEQVHD